MTIASRRLPAAAAWHSIPSPDPQAQGLDGLVWRRDLGDATRAEVTALETTFERLSTLDHGSLARIEAFAFRDEDGGRRAWVRFGATPGETLSTWHAGHSVDERAVLTAARGLAEALGAAKAAGAPLRRWRPDHVRVADDGYRWVLPTPGASRLVALDVRDGAPLPDGLGRLEVAAVAPEAWSGEHRSDDEASAFREGVWCFGATLVAALTGDTAYRGDTAETLRDAVRSGDARPLAAIDGHLTRHGELASLVARCLARQPEDRPASADELLAALDACEAEAQELAARRAYLPARLTDTMEVSQPTRLELHGPDLDDEDSRSPQLGPVLALTSLMGILLFLLLQNSPYRSAERLGAAAAAPTAAPANAAPDPVTRGARAVEGREAELRPSGEAAGAQGEDTGRGLARPAEGAQPR